MFESRNHDKIGTNGYGPVKQNWTDNLGYWMSMPKIMTFAREVAANGGKRIEKQEVLMPSQAGVSPTKIAISLFL